MRKAFSLILLLWSLSAEMLSARSTTFPPFLSNDSDAVPACDSGLLTIVSINFTDFHSFQISWDYGQGLLPASPVIIYRRESGKNVWTKAGEKMLEDREFTDILADSIRNAYEFKLETENACQQVVSSAIHSSIFLKAVPQEKDQLVYLKWNTFEVWKDPFSFQILRKTSQESDFSEIGKVSETVHSFVDPHAGDDFVLQYRVCAVNENSKTNYCSQVLTCQFQYQLVIPDVFTPNGDGFNDEWEINHLELYPEYILQVYNRNGKLIYEGKAGSDPWNGSDPWGDGESCQTYLWIMKYHRNSNDISGKLTVIRK